MRLLVAVMLLAAAAAAAAAESPPASQSVTGAAYAFRPNVDDYYPSASRSRIEEGTPRIELCYDERGRPAEVTVVESSGFKRLDDAAVRYGKAVRIRPGTIDGKAQAGCVKFFVRFSLNLREGTPGRSEGALPPVQVPPIRVDIPPPPPPPHVRQMPIPLAPSPPVQSIPLGGETGRRASAESVET
jgi:TonB family protein